MWYGNSSLAAHLRRRSEKDTERATQRVRVLEDARGVENGSHEDPEVVRGRSTKRGKKKGVRKWLKIDINGNTESFEADKSAIMRRCGIPARDLRILDPLLSYPSTLLGRERAIVVNLEHIKCIIMAEEVLLIDTRTALSSRLVEELRIRLPVSSATSAASGIPPPAAAPPQPAALGPLMPPPTSTAATQATAAAAAVAAPAALAVSPAAVHSAGATGPELPAPAGGRVTAAVAGGRDASAATAAGASILAGAGRVAPNVPAAAAAAVGGPNVASAGAREATPVPTVAAVAAAGGPIVLPFEFRALEVCLETVCGHLEEETVRLEKVAYPALDELSRSVSTLNLERVRQIKSRLVVISGRVQKLRDELEQLLDDDEDMDEMYLTDKRVQEQLLQQQALVAYQQHHQQQQQLVQQNSQSGSVDASAIVPQPEQLSSWRGGSIADDDVQSQRSMSVADWGAVATGRRATGAEAAAVYAMLMGGGGGGGGGGAGGGVEGAERLGALPSLLPFPPSSSLPPPSHPAAPLPPPGTLLPHSSSTGLPTVLSGLDLDLAGFPEGPDSGPGTMAVSGPMALPVVGVTPMGVEGGGGGGSERSGSERSGFTGRSSSSSGRSGKWDVEELEMLLEAYFVQVEGTMNKLTTLSEYVDDTEDYINIMLDERQNRLLELNILILTCTLCTTGFLIITGLLAMNIHIPLYDSNVTMFCYWIFGSAGATACLIFLAVAYYRWQGIIGRY